VADCDFSSGICGWNIAAGFAWANGTSIPDHTEDTANRYLSLSQGQKGMLVSPAMPTSQFGFNCVLSMYVFTSNVSQSSFAVHVINSTNAVESDTWRGRLASNQWHLVRVPIHPYDDVVTVQVEAVAPSSGQLLLDDIDLQCGDATEGECACLPGFVDDSNTSALGGDIHCVVDPNEVIPTSFPPVNGIDTCRNDTALAGMASLCRARDESTVCALVDGALKLYKNLYCARCNGVNSFTPGLCPPAVPNPGPTVGECTQEALATLSRANAALYQRECQTVNKTVCYNGTNFRNAG
jgi:hypothetical protein